MAYLIPNSTPAQRARGQSFGEKFQSAARVALNGGEVFGTPTIDFGAVCNGTTDYFKYAISDAEYANFSAINYINPDFSLDDTNFQYFVDLNSQIILLKRNTGNFTINSPVGNVAIPKATIEPYWRVGQRNVLSLCLEPSQGALYLNEGVIYSGAGVGTASALVGSTLTIGASNSGVSKFSGTLLGCDIFKSCISQAEHTDFYAHSTYNYRNKAIGDWPMLDAQAELTQTLDVSGNNNHAVLGAGAAAPTKIAWMRGYNFNSDYMSVANNASLQFGTGNFSFFAMARSGVADSQFRLIVDKGFGSSSSRIRTGINNANQYFLDIGGTFVQAGTVAAGSIFSLVGVRDGDDICLFINGVLIGTTPGAAAKVISNSNPLYLGSRDSTPGNYWIGEIGECGIVPLALTPLKVADLHGKMKRSINRV